MKKIYLSRSMSYLIMALLSLFLMAAYGCAGVAPKEGTTTAEQKPPPLGNVIGSDVGGRVTVAVPPRETTERLIGSEAAAGGAIGAARAIPSESPDEETALANSSRKGLEKKDHYRTVWYGTNRAPDMRGQGYSDQRDNKMHYGKLTVFIPQSHKLGKIKSPNWYSRLLHKDSMEVEWSEHQRLVKNDFLEDIRKELDKTRGDEKIIFVYIHGYNVSFEKAAIRTAQLSEDLSINGVAAFYSWPSKAKVTGYLADEATVEASEDYMHEFLTFIADKKKAMGASTVHIIAHSMGNRGLLRVLNRLENERKGKKLFDKIFLAAPDVDSDVFKSQAKVNPKIASATTLYISRKDVAMKGEAEFIHQDFRVGYHPVTIMDGIETVSFEGKIDLLTFGHLYYTDPVVLCHLYEKIHGVAPTSAECQKISKADKETREGKYTIIK